MTPTTPGPHSDRPPSTMAVDNYDNPSSPHSPMSVFQLAQSVQLTRYFLLPLVFLCLPFPFQPPTTLCITQQPPLFLTTHGHPPTSIHFVLLQKRLETTQASQSVIVLPLDYICRPKERNRSTSAQSGSEFKMTAAALMMVNRFWEEYVLPFLLISISILTDYQYHNPQTTMGHNCPQPWTATSHE